MKKFIFIFLLLCTFIVPTLSWGAACTAGTLVKAKRSTYWNSSIRIMTATWESDAAGDVNGTTSCDIPINGYIYMVITDPSADAPTDDYDIVLNDADGADVMGGQLANRDTSVSEQVIPTVDGVPISRFVNGSVALVVSNAGASKDGVIIIYIYVK